MPRLIFSMFNFASCVTSLAHSGPSMAPKSKSQIEADLCVELVKTHVPSLDGKEYEDENMEEVIACYQTLLCALAIHSQRVNSSVLQQTTKFVFGSNPTAAKRFGDAISHALSTSFRMMYAQLRVVVRFKSGGASCRCAMDSIQHTVRMSCSNFEFSSRLRCILLVRHGFEPAYRTYESEAVEKNSVCKYTRPRFEPRPGPLLQGWLS